jgi:hypothetical protein
MPGGPRKAGPLDAPLLPSCLHCRWPLKDSHPKTPARDAKAAVAREESPWATLLAGAKGLEP